MSNVRCIGSFEPVDKLLHRVTLIAGRVAHRYDGRVNMKNDGFVCRCGSRFGRFFRLVRRSSATRIGPGDTRCRTESFTSVSADSASSPRGPGMLEFAIILDCHRNIFYGVRVRLLPIGGRCPSL